MASITKKTKAIEIKGNIKGMEDVNEIKEAIESFGLEKGDSFSLEIKDSFAMPSALIGYLMKLIQKDEIKLSICAGDARLVELLDDLGFTKAFNIRSKCPA